MPRSPNSQMQGYSSAPGIRPPTHCFLSRVPSGPHISQWHWRPGGFVRLSYSLASLGIALLCVGLLPVGCVRIVNALPIWLDGLLVSRSLCIYLCTVVGWICAGCSIVGIVSWNIYRWTPHSILGRCWCTREQVGYMFFFFWGFSPVYTHAHIYGKSRTKMCLFIWWMCYGLLDSCVVHTMYRGKSRIEKCLFKVINR